MPPSLSAKKYIAWAEPKQPSGVYSRVCVPCFSGTDDWRRFGVGGTLEDGPHRHKYSAPKGKWVRIEIVLERKRITVTADGTKVAECEADLSELQTFAVAFGDQTMTRVELDELTIR